VTNTLRKKIQLGKETKDRSSSGKTAESKKTSQEKTKRVHERQREQWKSDFIPEEGKKSIRNGSRGPKKISGLLLG